MNVGVRPLLPLLGLLVALSPTRARACGTCAVGDPTLTTLGSGQPATGRVRAGLVARHHRETLRAAGGRWTLQQERYELGLVWTPSARWKLQFTLPFAYQRIGHPNLARTRRWSWGDVAARVGTVLYRDRTLGPRHLLVGAVGAELPTTSRPRNVPDELYAGSASWDLTGGLSYLFFASPWSMLLGTRLVAPLAGLEHRPAPALQVLGGVQWQPLRGLGGRLSAQIRHEFGAGGGSLLRLGGGVVVAPASGVVLHAQLTAPAWQTGRSRREGFAVEIGATVDL